MFCDRSEVCCYVRASAQYFRKTQEFSFQRTISQPYNELNTNPVRYRNFACALRSLERVRLGLGSSYSGHRRLRTDRLWRLPVFLRDGQSSADFVVVNIKFRFFCDFLSQGFGVFVPEFHSLCTRAARGFQGGRRWRLMRPRPDRRLRRDRCGKLPAAAYKDGRRR